MLLETCRLFAGRTNKLRRLRHRLADLCRLRGRERRRRRRRPLRPRSQLPPHAGSVVHTEHDKIFIIHCSN